MKKLLLVAACIFMAGQAEASKARLISLQGAEFLKDTQTIFENPAHVHALGQYLTFEFGTAAGATRAEGGFLKNEGSAKFGAYLGHQNAEQDALRGQAGFLTVNNPIEVFYGKDKWGASVYLSRNDQKTTNEEQMTIGGRFGIDEGNVEYYGSLDLIATAENGNDEYETMPLIKLGYERDAGRFYWVGQFQYAMGEQKIAGQDQDIDGMSVKLGVLDRSLAAAGRNLYYGAFLKYAKNEWGNAEETSFRLPVVIGIEYDLNDWAVLRASIQQDFLLGYDDNGANKDGVGDDTTVAAGLGLK